MLTTNPTYRVVVLTTSCRRLGQLRRGLCSCAAPYAAVPRLLLYRGFFRVSRNSISRSQESVPVKTKPRRVFSQNDCRLANLTVQSFSACVNPFSKSRKNATNHHSSCGTIFALRAAAKLSPITSGTKQESKA